MADKETFLVSAELVDVRDDKRYFAGERFVCDDEKQVERLTRAGCLKPWKGDAAEQVRAQLNEDGLFDKTVKQLRELADEEKVELDAANRKDEIVEAIRASRRLRGETPPPVDPVVEPDGLDDLDRAALEAKATEAGATFTAATDDTTLREMIRKAATPQT